MTLTSELKQQYEAHDPCSDSFLRVVAGLSLEQAKALISHEADGRNNQDALAYLSSQVTWWILKGHGLEGHAPKTDTIRIRRPDPTKVTLIEDMSLHQQSQIHHALVIALQHVRHPIQGGALDDLEADLREALAAMGTSL